MIDSMQQKEAPKASVCVITYNQERYIRQCLQSIVDQEVDFDFEVIVGDDCSTDGTREIVKCFEDMYPGIVTAILNEKNSGGMGNYLAVHRAARGEYVCHVDGDDWACPDKLARQVRYLDGHRECTLVAHRMVVWDAETQVGITRRNPDLISLSTLLRHHPMFVHSSIMYRRDRLKDVFAQNATFIDFYLYIAAALRGDIGFINDILGNYRRNIGLSCKRELMPYIQAAINLAACNVGESAEILQCRARQYLSYAVASLRDGEKVQFSNYISSARNCNNKNIVIFLMFYMKEQFWFIRFFVLLYKSSKSTIFDLRRKFLFGRNE